MHQLIREPVGLQAACGNVVDEQLDAARNMGSPLAGEHCWAQRSPGLRTTGPFSTGRRQDAMRRILRSFPSTSRGWGMMRSRRGR